MRKLLNSFTSRAFIIGILVLLQFVILLSLVLWLSRIAFEIYLFFVILSVLMVIYIINKKGSPSYAIAWVIIILVFPVFGGILYLLFGDKKVPKDLRRKSMEFESDNSPALKQDEKIMEKIFEENRDVYKQVNYVWKNAFFPIYKNTTTEYYPVGEKMYESLLRELQKAEQYIFIESFIIKTGVMWDGILEILEEKAKQGVDVRVMYDDYGCVIGIPKNYDRVMKKKGIQFQAFNPLRPALVVQMNNRNHRKMCIIDGIVGFMGGTNIADEYINVEERFGYWKDSAIMLKGEAVWSMTTMFIQFWDFITNTKEELEKFALSKTQVRAFKSDGYVQPFSDSPTDDEGVGETVHMNIITQAKDYVYITTPYLIPSYEMIKDLTISSKNGVDIRIIVPHIPDKWYVHMVTKSNYEELLKNNIRIYEYTPGFIHAKNFVSDDSVAVIGSTNIDYRSYYLHYECGVLLYKNKAVKNMKEDFLDTLAYCQEITLEEVRNTSLWRRVLQAILGLFSPLL